MTSRRVRANKKECRMLFVCFFLCVVFVCFSMTDLHTTSFLTSPFICLFFFVVLLSVLPSHTHIGAEIRTRLDHANNNPIGAIA